MPKKHIVFFLLLISFAFLHGCSKSSNKNEATSPITNIEVAPLLDAISLNSEIKLSATSLHHDGSKNNVTHQVQWNTSDNQIAVISNEGLLKPIATGTASITASLNDISATTSININSASLVSLNINPANPQLYVGTEVELDVFGIYDDGSKQDLTNSISWQIEKSDISSITDNIIRGIATGTTTVTATFEGLSTTSSVTVKDATLISIEMDFVSNTYYAGNNIELQATGIFLDNKKQDISDLVTWSYSSGIPVTGKNNSLTVNTEGELSITATLGNVSRSETLTISPATLDTLEILTSHNSISAGNNFQLRAIGHYSNGKTSNLSKLVTWATSNEDFLSISNAIDFEGHAISKKAGNITVTATYGALSQDFALNISEALLTNIDITLQRQSISTGTSTTLTATGIYSDNSTRDISEFVSWTSENPTIAHVSNQDQTQGLVTGLSTGSTKVFAKLDSISSSAEITVTEATLVDIFIDRFIPNPTINTSQKLKAIGIFSDGSKQDITNQVLWSSSDTNVATISNDDNHSGDLNLNNTGNSEISASFETVRTSVTTVVSDALISRIVFLPDTQSIIEGTSDQLKAIAILSNNEMQDITELATWSSDLPTTLNVNNNENKKGVISALSVGEANITAAYNGTSASKTLAVESATLSFIEVSHQLKQVANQTKLELLATGIFTNGSHHDITKDVLWESDNPDIVYVSNAHRRKGFAYMLSAGSATARATFGTITGGTSITVNDKTLDAITVLTDSNTLLATGNKIQLTAIGNYSDGSTQDISNQVTWQSSDSTVCIVSTAETNYGILQTKKIGSCHIRARFKKTEAAITFTVSDATLQSISLSPGNLTLAKGSQATIIATGHYSDGNSLDISQQVTWSIDNTNATINDENKTNVVVSANNVGDSVLTAHFGTISTTAAISITAATLTSIEIAPLTTGDFITGINKSYIATGNYSDQSMQDITNQVLWQSSDSTIASANNSYNSAGEFSGQAAGSATLTASLNTVTSNQLVITVIADPLAPVSLSLRATPYIILNDGTDVSDIALTVQASDSLQKVADNTEIQLSVINGAATLSATSALTLNGEAAFSLTSSTKGLITIKATITGTEVVNYVSIYATDNFSETIARYGFASGSLENNLVATGSQFGMLIYNFSNRSFTLDGYRVYNGTTIVTEITDATSLNNNLLPAGSSVSAVYTTTQALSNDYFVVFYLTEPITGQHFIASGGFQLK